MHYYFMRSGSGLIYVPWSVRVCSDSDVFLLIICYPVYNIWKYFLVQGLIYIWDRFQAINNCAYFTVQNKINTKKKIKVYTIWFSRVDCKEILPKTWHWAPTLSQTNDVRWTVGLSYVRHFLNFVLPQLKITENNVVNQHVFFKNKLLNDYTVHVEPVECSIYVATRKITKEE